jgi:negative regulator of replication initiation
MDEFEFLDPVDVVAKLPANYIELIESKKWQERKEALEIFLKLLTDNPRLDTKPSYGETVETLKKLLEKDSNINVQSLAAKCLTCVAKGLRAKFGPFAPTVMPAILDKFKEKKPLLRDPLVECVDAVYATSNFDAIFEDTMAAMGKPNPQIKIQVDLFLYRVFKQLNATNAPKKQLKTLAPVLLKHLADPDPEVRDAACSALGAIMKAIGKKSALVLIGDVAQDKLKMTKIEEAHDKAVAEAEQEAAATAAAQKPTATASSSGETNDTDGPVSAAGASAKCKVVEPEEDPWDMLDPVDVVAKLPANYAELIESKKWQERKEALETFLKLLTDNPRLDPKQSYGETVETLKKLLEKDSNINVQSLAAKCLTCVAKGLRAKFGPFAPTVMPAILDKFKEKKPLLRDPLVECVDAVYATSNFDAIIEDTMTAMGKPNPHIKIQVDLFLYRVFKQLNATNAPKKQLKTLAPILIKVCSCLLQ